MASAPSAGARGRWVEVDPARVPRWVAGFAERHGDPVQSADGRVVRLVAPDGAVAQLHAPAGAPDPGDLADLVATATQPRRLALLLARRGSVAVGLAEGERLMFSKVDSSYVQGRTAAGGWSQRRFARRRENQAKAAAGAAADLVAALLLPELARLDAMVAGGDRRTVEAILGDRRLAGLAELRAPRLLDVGEPRLAVLERAVARARAVRIWVAEPAA